MTQIDIGICTFRRVHVADTLRSLSALELPADYTIHIIVADNDDTPSAKELVENTGIEAGLNISYIHAPARNISIARNACLKAATASLFAFIDDDELAQPKWLLHLLNIMGTTNADAVLGPVNAQYNSAYPAWLAAGDFYSTKPVFVNEKIITGYCGNVLIKRTVPAFTNIWFRENLGITGGEDTAFFTEIVKAGGTIAYAPEAWLTEAVVPERASFSWLVKRRFRAGQTHGMLLGEAVGNNIFTVYKIFCIALAKAVVCFAMSVAFCANDTKWRFWFLRGAIHMGVVIRLMGKSA